MEILFSHTLSQDNSSHIHPPILLTLSYTAAQVWGYILSLFCLNKFYRENTLLYHSLALSLFLNIGFLLFHCSMEILFSHTLFQDNSKHIHFPLPLILSDILRLVPHHIFHYLNQDTLSPKEFLHMYFLFLLQLLNILLLYWYLLIFHPIWKVFPMHTGRFHYLLSLPVLSDTQVQLAAFLLCRI